MWNAKRDIIDPYKLAMDVFGPEGTQICDQCIKFHRFRSFLAVFLSESLSYTSASMPVIDCIKCEAEKKTKAYAFAPLMLSESSLSGNQSVFKDLNVVQMGIDKENARWNN